MTIYLGHALEITLILGKQKANETYTQSYNLLYSQARELYALLLVSD
jgi:hypothetical protein